MVQDDLNQKVLNQRPSRARPLRIDRAVLTGAREEAALLQRVILRNQLVLRREYVIQRGPIGSLPVATQLLRRSKRDGVLLKTHLTLLWHAGSHRPSIAVLQRVARDARIAIPARATHADLLASTKLQAAAWNRPAPDDFWPHTAVVEFDGYARIFGLADPQTNGARRIRYALDQLAEEGLVQLERRRAQPWLAQVSDESQPWAPYTFPLTKKVGRAFVLPSELWTNGWMAVLSAPALATLLAAQEQSSFKQNFGSSDVGFWANEKGRKPLGLSEETYYDGVAELDAHGLLSGTSTPVRTVERYRDRKATTTRTMWAVHTDILEAAPPRRRYVIAVKASESPPAALKPKGKIIRKKPSATG